MNGQRYLSKRYFLEDEIGRGSAASVYRATDMESGRKVAVKVFYSQYCEDPRFAVRFRQHLKAIATLSHPNLVDILDYGVSSGQYYIVMEWMDGMNLSTYLTEHGLLSPSQAVSIARKACSALAAIHRQGLIHRGLKPQNIFLASDGFVKVSDVGLSGLLSETGLSRTNMILGGIRYLSPEQARGRTNGPQSDLYSLGLVLFEMVTGRLPFESNDVWSLVRMHAEETPPSPCQFNPRVPLELAKVVARALQKTPENRYPTAGEMGIALAHFQGDSRAVWVDPILQNKSKILRNLISFFRDPSGFRSMVDFLSRPLVFVNIGRTLPFGVVLGIQFVVSFLIAFAILYPFYDLAKGKEPPSETHIGASYWGLNEASRARNFVFKSRTEEQSAVTLTPLPSEDTDSVGKENEVCREGSNNGSECQEEAGKKGGPNNEVSGKGDKGNLVVDGDGENEDEDEDHKDEDDEDYKDEDEGDKDHKKEEDKDD